MTTLASPDRSPELLQRMKDHSESASWAVWEHDDITFPAEPRGLHTDAVLIAINRGGHGPQSAPLPPWTNFHTARRHNDHFLAVACRDTPLWGGYMTDLLEERQGRLAAVDTTPTVVDGDVAALVEELKLLDAREPLLVLIGSDAHRLATKPRRLAALASALGSDAQTIRWVHIPHYSAANGRVHGGKPERYRALVLRALDRPRVRRPWA